MISGYHIHIHIKYQEPSAQVEVVRSTFFFHVHQNVFSFLFFLFLSQIIGILCWTKVNFVRVLQKILRIVKRAEKKRLD